MNQDHTSEIGCETVRKRTGSKARVRLGASLSVRTEAGLAIIMTIALLGSVPPPPAQAQSAKSNSGKSTQVTYISPPSVPSPVRRYTRALGDRLLKPGKERETLSGTILGPNMNGPARLVWEAPGQA